MSETRDVTGPIVKALQQMGWMAIRLNSGTAKKGKYFIKLCPAGTPDMVAFRAGEPVLWVEAKTTAKGHTNKETNTAQAEFRAVAERLGHNYITATCLDDVLAALGQ